MIKIFAHRGYHDKNIQENSLASLKAAYKNNFPGIEFDIWYIKSSKQQLVIKHNQPEAQEIPDLPGLADYFLYQNHFDYWLDFKNLNQRNSKAALNQIKQIITNHNIDLDKLYLAPCITDQNLAAKIYSQIRGIFTNKVKIVAFCEELPTHQIKNYRQFLQNNQIKFLSINHNLITKELVKELKNITLFAWTVNDLARLRQLEILGVKNFASDKIMNHEWIF